MNSAFIRFGHGYENHSREGRCTAFDGFDIIAAPLHQEGDGWHAAFGDKARDSRVYRRGTGGAVTYASHAIKLARMSNTSSGLYILMHHGGGREVLSVPTFYDGGDLEAAILAMPERLQYALLYTIWQAASNARHEAERQTADKYRRAFADGTLKKRKQPSRGVVKVWIEQPPTPAGQPVILTIGGGSDSAEIRA
jgi:hypothetical protein